LGQRVVNQKGSPVRGDFRSAADEHMGKDERLLTPEPQTKGPLKGITRGAFFGGGVAKAVGASKAGSVDKKP